MAEGGRVIIAVGMRLANGALTCKAGSVDVTGTAVASAVPARTFGVVDLSMHFKSSAPVVGGSVSVLPAVSWRCKLGCLGSGASATVVVTSGTSARGATLVSVIVVLRMASSPGRRGCGDGSSVRTGVVASSSGVVVSKGFETVCAAIRSTGGVISAVATGSS